MAMINNILLLIKSDNIEAIARLIEDDGENLIAAVIDNEYELNGISTHMIDFLVRYELPRDSLVSYAISHRDIKTLKYVLSTSDIDNFTSNISNWISGYRANHSVEVKAILDILIDYYKSKVTLDDIVFVCDVVGDSFEEYIEQEALIYVISRIVDDHMLENSDIDTIEAILKIVLQNGGPESLVRHLLKYLPEDSIFRSQPYRRSLVNHYPIPSDYISIFAEDV